MCVCPHTCAHNLQESVSLLTMWVPRIELWSPCLTTGTFIHESSSYLEEDCVGNEFLIQFTREETGSAFDQCSSELADPGISLNCQNHKALQEKNSTAHVGGLCPLGDCSHTSQSMVTM